MRHLIENSRRVLGFLLVFAATSGVALAFGQGPEIDPGSAVSALTLLSCGMLMLTGRRRRS